MSKRQTKFIFAFCLLLVLLLGGCSKGNRDSVLVSDASETSSSEEENTVGELAFCSFSDGRSRYIECYNTCCEAYGNTNLLKTDAGWRFSDGSWHYRQYDSNWLEPEIQVFEDSSGSILEIRIGFEDHGYTEWGEALSVERAFYTLRCLNETAEDEEINQLISDIESEMKIAVNYVEPGESPEIMNPIPFGDYEVYHFFSAGIYYLCITDGKEY